MNKASLKKYRKYNLSKREVIQNRVARVIKVSSTRGWLQRGLEPKEAWFANGLRGERGMWSFISSHKRTISRSISQIGKPKTAIPKFHGRAVCRVVRSLASSHGSFYARASFFFFSTVVSGRVRRAGGKLDAVRTTWHRERVYKRERAGKEDYRRKARREFCTASRRTRAETFNLRAGQSIVTSTGLGVARDFHFSWTAGSTHVSIPLGSPLAEFYFRGRFIPYRLLIYFAVHTCPGPGGNVTLEMTWSGKFGGSH